MTWSSPCILNDFNVSLRSLTMAGSLSDFRITLAYPIHSMSSTSMSTAYLFSSTPFVGTPWANTALDLQSLTTRIFRHPVVSLPCHSSLV